MRRWFLVCLLFVLPLQWSVAATGMGCQLSGRCQGQPPCQGASLASMAHGGADTRGALHDTAHADVLAHQAPDQAADPMDAALHAMGDDAPCDAALQPCGADCSACHGPGFSALLQSLSLPAAGVPGDVLSSPYAFPAAEHLSKPALRPPRTAC